jgi:hypothetical protein
LFKEQKGDQDVKDKTSPETDVDCNFVDLQLNTIEFREKYQQKVISFLVEVLVNP